MDTNFILFAQRPSMHFVFGLISFTAFVSCSPIAKDAGFAQVNSIVNQRTGSQVQWMQDANQAEASREAVNKLLENGISQKSAVEIALLNNRELQATFEHLGFSQAELIASTQLDNPTLFGMARFPGNSETGSNIELDLGQNLLQLLMLPLRKRLAEAQLEETQLRLADNVMKFIVEVRTAYFTHLGALQLRDLMSTIEQSTEASDLFAKRLLDAGNISELELANREDAYQMAKVELAKSELEVRATREKLNRMLSLWGVAAAQWSVSERLPALPDIEFSLENLESLAISQRLDLQATKKEVDLVADSLGITRNWRWLTAAEIGASAERELDGTWVIGPTLALEIPVFNQKQSEIRMQEAILRRSVNEFVALAVEIRTEVRMICDRLSLARSLVQHYKTSIIPLREKIVRLSQEQYNFMLLGAFELLSAREHEVDAYREYVEAVRDYWIAQAELERAVGGQVGSSQESQVTNSAEISKDTSSEQQHHHGGD